jgi:hypothetical protein
MALGWCSPSDGFDAASARAVLNAVGGCPGGIGAAAPPRWGVRGCCSQLGQIVRHLGSSISGAPKAATATATAHGVGP